jgi:hypothetical protein
MKVQVLSPVAERVDFKVPPAPRLNSLAGKRIGLYGNQTGGDDHAVNRVGQLLQQRFPGVQVVKYGGAANAKPGRPALSRGVHIDDEEAKRIANEVDAIVGATAH